MYFPIIVFPFSLNTTELFIVLTVRMRLAEHTEAGVVAESTLLNEYVVVEVGFTSTLAPEPMEVPAQESFEK